MKNSELKNIIKEEVRSVLNEKNTEWPGEINYGDKKYILSKQKDGRVTYEHEKYKGDKLTFGSKKEMDDYLGAYTYPKGGTQSTQLESLDEISIPTQDEIHQLFSDTQNETHYLNSKPVEEWDEYDLSNWKAKVRKKEQGRPSFG